MPDGTRSVIGHEQRSVLRFRNTHRPSPDFAVGGHEPGEEVFILSGGVAVLHRQPNDLVAGALGAIPRAMFRSKSVTVVFSRELRALVEEHFKRSKMGIHEDIWRDHLGLQLGMLSGVARILLAAVGAPKKDPRPAIKSTFLHVRHVVWHEIIAQPVALVGGAPQLAGEGIDGFTDAGAQGPRVDRKRTRLNS